MFYYFDPRPNLAVVLYSVASVALYAPSHWNEVMSKGAC